MVSETDSRLPPEIWHPSVFIQEELDARGWSRDMLALRMGPEFGINRLVLDLYFEVGPTKINMNIGHDTAVQLGRAFNVSPEYFENLHATWLKGQPAND